jgi:Flp pilus assembly protein TadG
MALTARLAELRDRLTSAADLKFLQRLRQTHFRNFKSKSGTRSICLLVPLLLPKFVSEGAAMYHELRKRGTSLAADQRGVSAVEFAMLLPLMLALYLGGVEVSQAVSVDRKVTLTARAVADLVAQATTVSSTDMSNILDAATAVAAPFPVASLKVTVSQVKIDAQGNATIEWSDARNTSARPVNQVVTVPTALNVPNTWLIWGEVQYNYTPTIGYVITGTMTLKDQIYMRPRLSDSVTHT